MKRIDALIDDLSDKLVGMTFAHVAAFEACCATRLQPLYDDFYRETSWGSPTVLAHVVGLTWSLLADENAATSRDCSEALAALAQAVPHADDFDLTECTLAQDACICAEASLRRICKLAHANTPAVDAALEAIRTYVCVEKTGCYDLGDSPEADAFEGYLLSDRRFRAEVEYQRADIHVLASAANLERPLLDLLQRKAVENAWSTKLLQEWA